MLSDVGTTKKIRKDNEEEEAKGSSFEMESDPI